MLNRMVTGRSSAQHIDNVSRPKKIATTTKMFRLENFGDFLIS